MSEQEKTANQNAEGGAQQETVTDVAGGDDQQNQTGTETTAGAEQNKETEGLKAALVAEQKKRQEAEQRASQYEAAIQYQQQLAANQMSQQQQQNDYDPDGYVQNKDLQQFGTQIVSNIQLQTIRGQLSDLDDVIGSNAGTPTYKPSDNVKKIILQNPALYSGLDNLIRKGNPQAIGVAYDLAKKQVELEKLQKIAQAAQEQSEHQGAENQTTPTSPALAGGGGGVSFESQVPSPVTEPDKFDAFYEQVKAGVFNKRS